MLHCIRMCERHVSDELSLGGETVGGRTVETSHLGDYVPTAVGVVLSNWDVRLEG